MLLCNLYVSRLNSLACVLKTSYVEGREMSTAVLKKTFSRINLDRVSALPTVHSRSTSMQAPACVSRTQSAVVLEGVPETACRRVRQRVSVSRVVRGARHCSDQPGRHRVKRPMCAQRCGFRAVSQTMVGIMPDIDLRHTH